VIVNEATWARDMEAAHRAFADRERALEGRMAELHASLTAMQDNAATNEATASSLASESAQESATLYGEISRSTERLEHVEAVQRALEGQLEAEQKAALQMQSAHAATHAALNARAEECSATASRLLLMLEDSAREREAIRASSENALTLEIGNAQLRESGLQDRLRDAQEALRRLQLESAQQALALGAATQAREAEIVAQLNDAHRAAIALRAEVAAMTETHVSDRHDLTSTHQQELAALRAVSAATEARLQSDLEVTRHDLRDTRDDSARQQETIAAAERDTVLLEARLRAAEEHVNAAQVQARAQLDRHAAQYARRVARLQQQRSDALAIARNSRRSRTTQAQLDALQLAAGQDRLELLQNRYQSLAQRQEQLIELLEAERAQRTALGERLQTTTLRASRSETLLWQAERPATHGLTGSLRQAITQHFDHEASPLVMPTRQRDLTMNATKPPQSTIESPDLSSLLALPGPMFVHATYLVLLGRAPDPESFLFFRARLQEGVSKLQILGEFADSEEAKARRFELPGLRTALQRHTARQSGWRHRLIAQLGLHDQQEAFERRMNRLEARIDEELLSLDASVDELRTRMVAVSLAPSRSSSEPSGERADVNRPVPALPSLGTARPLSGQTSPLERIAMEARITTT
jgi:hypothetical protein